MEIKLDWQPGGRAFTGIDEKGNTIHLDGYTEAGVSPMNTLLFALGGCSGIDMVAILEKMKQEIKTFSIEVKGEREEVGKAKIWKKMHLIFHLTGEIEPAKAERAMNLSLEKYCSVALTLANVEITGEYHLA